MTTTEYRKHCEYYIEKMERVYFGETPEQPFFLSGVMSSVMPEYDYDQDDFGGLLPIMRERLYAAMESLEENGHFQPLVLQQLVYGHLLVSRMLGAKARFYKGQWWSEKMGFQVGTLQAPDLDKDPLVRKLLRFVEQMVEHSDGLFYIAYQVIHSAFIVAVDLLGEGFLLAMVEEPNAARHDLEVIAGVLSFLQEKICSIIPPAQFVPYIGDTRFTPPGVGIIDGCTTQLISSGTYASLVEPLDARLASYFPRGALMHLCGSSSQHIPAFRGMAKLRCVQLNDRAAEDYPLYYHGLREDQIIYIMPTVKMDIKEIIRISGGRRTIVARHRKPFSLV